MLLIMVPAAGQAAIPPPAPLTAQDTLELQRVAAYLNGIRTMSARFAQVTGTGARSSGRMWVARPGRMRFEYDPPNPITLLADSFYLYYWDKELQQAQKVGLKSTPAWFLLRDPIDFGADVIVTKFSHEGPYIRITVVQSAAPDDGSLTMVFSANPVALLQWTVVDQQGRVTTVNLSDLQYGMALNPNLFQYHDPYEETHREH
jgi:outer membrane lipoprotein-sorting protein